MVSFWLSALLPLLRLVGGSSGEEKAEKVIGALGESVTFQLKFSKSFESISWLRNKKKEASRVFALLNPEENCAAITILSEFKGRLNVSEDCKRLEVKNLDQDDSGTYQAQIQLRGVKKLLDLYFDLHVYKRLSGADLSIQCKGIGNGTWQLNCSAGPWEDDVEFGIASCNQRKVTERSCDIRLDSEESNPNVTCMAKNPVSNASRTETLKEICAEQPAAGSTTGPESQNENNSLPSPGVMIGVIIAALFVTVICCVALYCWKKRKGDSRQPLGSADPGGCNTIYARVGDVAEERDSHYSQPRTQPAKGKPKKAQTVYTTVDHACKPNPLQTDDEKMQKGRRRAAEKTIYSEISTKPQEDEDQSLKTVYETVKNPKPPREQEYDKII